jgi:hypothetical protein
MPIPYTIRECPDNLHYAWKIISALRSTSMRVYILKALREQLKKDIAVLQKNDSSISDLIEKLEVV